MCLSMSMSMSMSMPMTGFRPEQSTLWGTPEQAESHRMMNAGNSRV